MAASRSKIYEYFPTMSISYFSFSFSSIFLICYMPTQLSAGKGIDADHLECFQLYIVRLMICKTKMAFYYQG